MKRFDGSNSGGIGRFLRRQPAQHNVAQSTEPLWHTAKVAPATFRLLLSHVGSEFMDLRERIGSGNATEYARQYLDNIYEQLGDEDTVQDGHLAMSDEFDLPPDHASIEPVGIYGVAEAARLIMEESVEESSLPIDTQAADLAEIGYQIGMINGFIGRAYDSYSNGRPLPVYELGQSRLHPGL